MKSNISQTDKIIRIALGVALGLTGIFIGQIWLSIAAIVILATAMIDFCPIYAIFGFSTHKYHASPFQAKNKKKKH
jgi:hypothetical protein